MIQGLNSNVPHDGVVYHVQTQDLGVDNPQVVTMIYRGGAIVSSRATDYSEWADTDDMAVQVRELVTRQHHQMISALQAGQLPPGEK